MSGVFGRVLLLFLSGAAPLVAQNAFPVRRLPSNPDRLAHVWGDNFEKGGSIRDLTFLPRASHESITCGSAGIFATAGDLTMWCSSLFHGKSLKD